MSINCLYIPNTFGVDHDYVKFVFERDYCKVDHIELIGKYNPNGEAYTSARIHVGEWYSTIVSNNFIRRLQNNNYARIIYHDANEMYWNVMPNKTSNTRQPRLNLSALKQEEAPCNNTPMLSNSDFAAMYKDDIDFEDIEFRSACRRLIVDDVCDNLVSEDYVLKLEDVISQQNEKIEQLTRELTKIKRML